MTENEKKFVNKYLEYYKKYNGNIPYQVWTKEGLSDYRQSLGISLKRSSELTIEAVRTLNQIDNNMDENSVVKIFKRELSDWVGLSSDYDCATYKNHYKNGNMYIPQYKANFKIGLDEEVLFTRDTSFWNNHNQGLVITDKAIYVLVDNDNPNDILVLPWEEFDQVVYHDEKFFFYAGNEEIIWLGFYLFTKFNSRTFDGGPGPANTPKLEKIAQVLSKMAQSVENPLCNIEKLLEIKEYKKALKIANDLIVEDSSNVMARYRKCICLYYLGIANDSVDKSLLNDSLREGEILLKLLSKEETMNTYPIEDIKRGRSWTFQAMAKCSEALDFKEKAREYLIRALDVDEIDEQKEVTSELDIIEKDLKADWDVYTQKHNYKDRRLVMFIQDTQIGGCITDGIKTFRISNIPSDFVFPITMPVVNQLYIGHKYNPRVYVPFEEAEDYFFHDKVNELCRLLDCLGAKQIIIKSIKGKKVGEINGEKSSERAHGEYGKFGNLDVDHNSQSKTKEENENHLSQERVLTFGKPNRWPYVPTNLHWYDNENDWQNIAQQRISGNGGVLSYKDKISTSKTRFYSSSELDSINASVQVLLAKANGNMSKEAEREFRENIETVWEISVDFWALDDFDKNKSSQTFQKKLTDNEEKYKEEVLFYLEDDGIIDDEERRFLERKRVRLGISEDRAKKIEEECMSQLTSEEKEYLESLKELGEVDLQNPRIRRMLDHERDDLGISEERALELEKQYCNK